jgi:hypothetical protein
LSGKSKGAPASPEEERAQLRQLTRELHEAAQDARDAARELRTARDGVREAAKTAVAEYANGGIEILAKTFRESRETLKHFEKTVAEKTDKAIKDIEDNHARLAGFKNSEEFARFLVKEIFESLVHEPYFIRDVAAATQQISQISQPPQIQVGTREQLAAFIAAGGDPGIIIDAAE